MVLQIPITHACYSDHFPGDPLVPGALLLKWIGALIEKNLATKITHYKQIKLLIPVRPGERLNILDNGAQNASQLSLSVQNIALLDNALPTQSSLTMKGQFSIATPTQLNCTAESQNSLLGIAHE
jgi:3-hydroxymyristoyl/3-hydroxydecanoyl-(acyl carrier protein) dehydratase